MSGEPVCAATYRALDVSIKVEDDKTCSVVVGDGYLWGSVIAKLTPEKATEVKRALQDCYRTGMQQAFSMATQAIHEAQGIVRGSRHEL